jgi:competence protein ComEC
VSVGENSFGHPTPDLLAALIAAGMTIRRTDIEGDVVVPLK